MQIDTLEEKTRGRPSILLSEVVTSDIKRYITTLRDAGGVVNTSCSNLDTAMKRYSTVMEVTLIYMYRKVGLNISSR